MEHATFDLTLERDKRPSKPLSRYEDEAHAWAVEQAELIRLGRFDELDIDHLIDEVRDVACRERKEPVSRFSPVDRHLLTWDRQPERRSASWARTITEQRRQVDELLGESPSLPPFLSDLTDTAFRRGRVGALNEIDLSDAMIPEPNPCSWDEMMARPIRWPEP